MKKLFLAITLATVALNNTCVLATSKLLAFDTVEVLDEKVYTCEEMFKLINESAQNEKLIIKKSEGFIGNVEMQHSQNSATEQESRFVGILSVIR